MNAKISRMWRSGVALLLALCLVVGFVPAAFAAEVTKDDVNNAVDTAIAEIEATLGDLAAVLEKYAPNAPEAIWNLWVEQGYVADVEAAIAALSEQLPGINATLQDEILPAIGDAIADMEDEKDALVDALEDLNAALAAKKAALEEVLANQEIGDVYIPNISIDGIGGNEQTEVPENECVVEGEGIVAELKAAIADLEHAAAVIAALIADIEADLVDMANLVAQIMAAGEELELSVASIIAVAGDVKVAYENIKEVLTTNNGKVTDAVAATYEAAKKAATEAVEVLKLAVAEAHKLDAGMAELIATANDKAEALHDKVVADLTEWAIEVNNIEVIKAALDAFAAEGGAEGALVEDIKAMFVAVMAAKEYLTNEETDLKADTEAAIETLLELYADEIEAAEKALTDKWAEIEPQIEAKYEELKAEIEAEYKGVIAALEAQKLALEAEIEAAKAALKNAAEDAVAPLKAQIERLEKDLATVKADLAHAAAHFNTALKLAYEEAKIAVMALYNEVMAELYKAIEELKAQLKQALEDLKNAGKEMIEEAIREALEGILGEIVKTLEELKNALIAMGIETIEELVAALEALFNEMLYNATHADLVIDEDFTYVALGDGTAMTESYAEELAAALAAEAAAEGIESINFLNAAFAGNTVAAEAAALTAEAAEADLITLGFSQTDMLANAVAALMAGEASDWAALLGEEAVPYVNEALAAVAEKVAALELDADLEALVNALVEAYAYNAVEFAVELPALIKAIRDVNAEAVVIVVGLYNPVEAVTVDLRVMEPIKIADFGAEYFDYLVEAVDAYGIGLAMLTGAMDFVSAPEVEIANADLDLDALDAILEEGDFSALYPSAKGDAYIAEQIANALNLSFEIAGLWGDADGDGAVTPIDAMLVLQFYVGDITEADLNVAVCDVDGDGFVSPVDAMLILQHYVGDITVFPVEA